jgi:hypothetical protein
VENREILQVPGMLGFLDGVIMSPQSRVIKIVLKLFIFPSERQIACKNSGLYGSAAPK